MLSALLTLLVAVSPAWAANSALEIHTRNEADVPAQLRSQLHGILSASLNFLAAFPPKTLPNNLFSWEADRAPLAGKSLTLIFATTRNPTVAKVLSADSVDMDSLTIGAGDLDTKTLNIYVYLLVDKIFYDPLGREYTDGFSRLTVALAHEIYGNVQHFLPFDLKTARPQTIADRVRQQRNSFRASLGFLAELRERPEFKTLPPSVQKGLHTQWPLEVIRYLSWQNSQSLEDPDPVCEALLASYREDKK